MIESPSKNRDGIWLKLIALKKNLSIHYSLDGKEVTSSSPQYEDSILLTKSFELHANTFVNDSRAGRELSANFQFNIATGKKITLDPQPSEKYNRGGAFTLVDGQT